MTYRKTISPVSTFVTAGLSPGMPYHARKFVIDWLRREYAEAQGNVTDVGRRLGVGRATAHRWFSRDGLASELVHHRYRCSLTFRSLKTNRLLRQFPDVQGEIQPGEIVTARFAAPQHPAMLSRVEIEAPDLTDLAAMTINGRSVCRAPVPAALLFASTINWSIPVDAGDRIILQLHRKENA